MNWCRRFCCAYRHGGGAGPARGPGGERMKSASLPRLLGGVRVINVYVPNGQAVDSPKFY